MSGDRDPERRAAIVRAATTLFSRYGVRRTSMDLLAREAGVAKPTLYAYFEDKDAVFRAVAEQVVGDILEAARQAAAGSGAVEARLTQVLTAKFGRTHELVDLSPHAAELLASSEAEVARADAAMTRIVHDAVIDADARGEIALERSGVSARQLVDALLRAGHGAGWNAKTAAEHKKQLANLVKLLIAAVR